TNPVWEQHQNHNYRNSNDPKQRQGVGMTKNLLPPVLTEAAISFVAPMFFYFPGSRQTIYHIGTKGLS
ncbi:MAG: hypothetical protein ACYSU8_11205, partial [Planctomycetota bacterium]